MIIIHLVVDFQPQIRGRGVCQESHRAACGNSLGTDVTEKSHLWISQLVYGKNCALTILQRIPQVKRILNRLKL